MCHEPLIHDLTSQSTFLFPRIHSGVKYRKYTALSFKFFEGVSNMGSQLLDFQLIQADL